MELDPVLLSNAKLPFDAHDPQAAASFIAQQILAQQSEQQKNTDGIRDLDSGDSGNDSKRVIETEKVRLENRERKKRWRQQNEDRNKDNDLRCRVNKRASKMFGRDDTMEKQRWTDEEFAKRRSKRKDKERGRPSNGQDDTSVDFFNSLDAGNLSASISTLAAVDSTTFNQALTTLTADPDLVQNLTSLIQGNLKQNLPTHKSNHAVKVEMDAYNSLLGGDGQPEDSLVAAVSNILQGNSNLPNGMLENSTSASNVMRNRAGTSGLMDVGRSDLLFPMNQQFMRPHSSVPTSVPRPPSYHGQHHSAPLSKIICKDEFMPKSEQGLKLKAEKERDIRAMGFPPLLTGIQQV